MAKKRKAAEVEATVSIVPTDDQKVLQAFVKRRHPDYEENEEHWKFLRDTYNSAEKWFENNIFRFHREGEKTYQDRVARAYRFNHTREVVDLVNKYLFKNSPVRSEAVSPPIEAFRKKATLSGLTQAEFEQEASRKASIFGRIYAVVDTNKAGDGTTMSLADQAREGIRLHAFTVDPIDFLDCGYDDEGQYTWVLLREWVRDDDDPFNSTGALEENFRLWTRAGWAQLKAAGNNRIDLVREGSHDLGVVPVIKCDHIETDARYSVPALIEDIAYLDRAVANYLSNLDQIINDQTFSQLTMPAQALLQGLASGSQSKDPDDPDTKRAEREIVKLGTSQILLYDGEHGSKPEYISPDPRQASLIMAAIKNIINEIYHTVGLAGERTKQDNAVGIDNSSGVAKAFDFERVNALLSLKAKAMEIFANRLETLVGIYNGIEGSMTEIPDRKSVLYSTSFDVLSLREELAVAHELSLLAAPIEIRKQQMERIVSKLWPMLSPELAMKVQKAIDEWQDVAYSSLTTDLPSRNGDQLQPSKQGQNNKGSDEATPGRNKT